MAITKFISIKGKDYGICVYEDGYIHYCVMTERRNEHGRRIQRTLNTQKIQVAIMAAVVEADHAEALRMNDALDKEFASIDALAPDEDSKKKFKAIASKYEVGCVMGVSAAHEEALKMNILTDHAEIAESDLARRALCFRLNYTAEGRERRIKEAHAEALCMNEGIDIALRVLTCMKGAYKAEESVAGCLIRDGYHEVDYLVQVAARKYAQQGTAEITAHGI